MGEASPRPRVLVIDDDDDFRALGRRPLEAAGYEMVEARDAREAFDLLVHSPDAEPACILLDMMLPTMTGWDFLEMRSRYGRLARIPVIVLSSLPARAQASPQPPIAWLQKPQSWGAIIEI